MEKEIFKVVTNKGKKIFSSLHNSIVFTKNYLTNVDKQDILYIYVTRYSVTSPLIHASYDFEKGKVALLWSGAKSPVY
jgi:hypothetical protein